MFEPGVIGNLSTLEWTLVVLCIELSVLALYLIFSGPRREAVRAEAASAAADDLLTHVDRKESARREALSLILKEAYQLEGEDLERFTDEFAQREEQFYRAIADVFANQDYDRLKTISDELNKVIAPCISLVPRNQVPRAEAEALKAEVETLKTENTSLSDQIREHSSELEQMSEEYSAAFDKERSFGARKPLSAAAEADSSGADPAGSTAAEAQREVFDLSADDIDDLIDKMGEEPASSSDLSP